MKTNTSSSRCLRILVRAAERLGYDPKSLGRELGVNSSVPSESEWRVSHEVVDANWGRLAEVTADPLIGVRLGQHVELDDFDVIGYVLRNCRTMREVSERYAKYHRLLSDNTMFDVCENDSGWVLRHRSHTCSSFNTIRTEYVLSALAHVGELAFGDYWRLREVRFSHSRLKMGAEYEGLFGVPVRFESGENSLVVEVDLDRPFVGIDPALGRILEQHADALLERLPCRRTLDERVRVLIERSLPTGPPVVDEMASSMGMSPRSLRRHLADLGTSVSRIVAEVRRDQAFALLNSSEKSVGEIAYEIGFSEPSAFNRAFKRWTGRTPLDHRRCVRDELAPPLGSPLG